MRKLLSLLFLFFFIPNYSQNSEEIISTLKEELKNHPSTNKLASIYSDLTWYYANVSIDSALSYGNKAITETVKLNDSTMLAQVYSDIGAVYFRKPDFQNSEKYYLKAYKIRKIRKDNLGLAKINNNLANIYLNTNDFQAAMKTYLETLKYFESINDKKNVAVVKGNIGQLLTNLRDYPKSIKYLKEAAAYAEKENLKDRLCENYLNLAKAYESSGDYKNSSLYNNKALKNCLAIGNKKATSMIYQNLAIINSKINNDSLVKVNLKKSEDVGKEFNSTLDLSNLKLTQIKNLIKEKKFAESYKSLLEIKKVFENENSQEDLLYTYKYLIPVSAYMKHIDSVEFYTHKYSELFEKLIEKNVLHQTAELETKYQTAQKEKLLLEKEAENKKQTTWIIIISLLAGFITLIGFLIYRQQKLKNQQQQQEFQLKSAIAQIETQNQLQEQRLSISRDLHDNIGAQLTFVISSVDNLKYGNQISDNRIVSQLTKISDFTKSTIVELRDTIWAMNNNEFSFDDLRSRIFNFIEKAKSAKEEIAFKFNVDERLNEVRFSSIIGINLYRTIQEAINNAVKYSDATEIEVGVSKDDEAIKIDINDNGKGFDIDTVDFGNGLYNMKKRIEEVGGTFEIYSIPNKGTQVNIKIAKNQ
ncbi:MAG: sensor histidine kinase [Bacteroidota bacterium]